jgi:RimJ/RimL family protein N-acetyltransferase
MIEFSFAPFPCLLTANYSLRKLVAADEKEIFSLRSSDLINQYLDRPKATSIEDARKFIAKIIDAISRNESIFWVITPKNESAFLGTICLWNLSAEEAKADLGYELLPEHHGKGIMQEVIPIVLRFGFDEMNLQTIEAELSPRNLKSVRLLEKNNFTLLSTNPENSDSIVYSLRKPV